MTRITEIQTILVLKVLDEADKWMDANELLDGDADPNMDCMIDGYEFISEMVKIKKGVK